MVHKEKMVDKHSFIYFFLSLFIYLFNFASISPLYNNYNDDISPLYKNYSDYKITRPRTAGGKCKRAKI